MRLILSFAALGLLQRAAGTSAANTATATATAAAARKKPSSSLRRPTNTHRQRRLIETEGEFDEEAEIRQEDLGDAVEQPEPANPIEPAEPQPQPENPIELPTECKDCLGKDAAGAYSWVADGMGAGGSCVVSCDAATIAEGATCYSGTDNDDKVCKELEKAAEEAAKAAEEATKLA
eukprot:CAMPEP_0181073448 /NCGR_PEP_ID=MMETSP1070-20121207/29086_1 /TAXON_ID=265543 /ORGANISM="Minutocellus polymorphus, Strain NH13" /LENGTH=176 /DNA_ID=CAMNT_0023154523 /DNA_START=142 /DNA_END=670 /DNA_ORIENTATION=+